MEKFGKNLRILWAAAIVAVAVAQCACAGETADAAGRRVSDAPRFSKEAIADAAAPANLLMPEATGKKTYKSSGVEIDYSNAASGYVMLKSEKQLKLRIQRGDVTYTYDLVAGDWRVFPLSEGSGTYELRLLEKVEGTTYSVLFAKKVKAEIADETLPFLYPNQYVNYNAESDAVKWSGVLAQYAGEKNAELYQTLYRYVADNIQYDYNKAETVQSGYLPSVDETLGTGTGICFDYSSLLATMLRVQSIPTQLVTGYVGAEDMYHAWNRVYINGEWMWMDATLDREDRSEAEYTGDKQY